MTCLWSCLHAPPSVVWFVLRSSLTGLLALKALARPGLQLRTRSAGACAAELLRISRGHCITRTTADSCDDFYSRNELAHTVCSLCATEQSAQQCGSTNAPKRCSRRATASREEKKNERDILRRTAMHASHRRELLVPRERRRPVESQRASSHTPREFMAVQKRRFYVLRMPSHPHP